MRYGYSYEDAINMDFSAEDCLKEIRGHGHECDVVDDPDTIDGRMLVSGGEVIALDMGEGGFSGDEVLRWLGY